MSPDTREVSLCDVDTVPTATAASLDRWVSRLVEIPRPDKAYESIQLRISDILHMHMVARRDFDAGEIILRERPLLTVGPADSDRSEGRRKQLQEHYGDSRADFMAPVVNVDWERLSTDIVQAAMNLFWAHPLITRRCLSSANLDACKDFIERTPSAQRHLDGEGLLKFLHIVDLNIHKDDERGDPKHAGIFVLGSKFTHSCAPNCDWNFTPCGALQYRAIKRIASGDLLTFSYIGNGMNLLASTIERRRRLASLWFYCHCERCMGPDLARQLLCPACSEPRCLPTYSALEDWTGDRPLRELILDAEQWSCMACSASFASNQMPLDTEEDLANAVPQVMRWGAGETTISDAKRTDKLVRDTAKVVGARHWTWALFTFAWLQKWLVLSKREASLQMLDLGRLREGSVALARWFQEVTPANIEQRLSGLFLAARLASHFGGGLGRWGYDPVDPLHDDGASARLMATAGWKLYEDHVMSPEVEELMRRLPSPQPRRPNPETAPFCGVWA